MKPYDTVAIVGVGLIGGSVGLAIRKRKLAKKVVGIGRRAASLLAASRCGAVTSTTRDLAQGVAEAQLVIVCTPVDSVAPAILAAAQAMPPGALITDAGSTKQTIVEAVAGQLTPHVRFIGSHPLAGGEQSGPTAARADLFDGRQVVVTPAADSKPADLREISTLWKALGAKVVKMSPEEHDRVVAITSHLPHLVAAAMAAATPRTLLKMTAAGWHDTTRVAAGDVALWIEILRNNRGHVLKGLAEFGKVVDSLTDALERGDDQQLARVLSEAKRICDAART